MKSNCMITIVVLSFFTITSAYAEIRIRDYPPNTPINGKVVPSEAVFSPPLKQGEKVIVVIDGKNAMQIDVVEGEVTKLSTRFKLSTSGEITYERLVAGVKQESAKKYVLVKNGEAPNGSPSQLIKGAKLLREKVTQGSYKCLAYTKNGFGNILVLQEPGFKVEVTGTNAVSNNVYIGIEGNFSDKAISSFAEGSNQP